MRPSSMTPITLLCGCIALGMIYVVGMRLMMAGTTPLWLDETWSGMIATRPDWSSFWQEVWLDCNPPLYYILLAGWVSLFDDSNLMLRLPSVLFVLGAALLPLTWRPYALDRTGGRILAALILLWSLNLGLMIDARSYGLMLLLSTASCLAVARLLERLALPRAMAWVGIGTLMFLTHYYAAVLILGQIAVLLYRHGLGLARLWPATLLAMPGLAWFAYHLPRLSDYARPDISWYDPTTPTAILLNITYVLGAQNLIALLAIVTILGAALMHGRQGPSPTGTNAQSGKHILLLTALTAAIGLALAILVSLFQPSLTNRYLVPLVPTAMLGVTLLILRTTHPGYAATALTVAFLAPMLSPASMQAELDDRTIYGYEQSSDFIRAANPDRLLFLWDSPSARIMDQTSLAALGGYFLQRAGIDMPVTPLVVDRTTDPNRILRTAAKASRPAFIWLYNNHYRSAATAHPPTFQDDPSWHCNHGTRNDMVGSVACVKQVPPE